jgi:hypothetical protein
LSAEKYARGALRTVTTRRVACELLGGVSGVAFAIGRTAEGIARAFFIEECDAARRYEAATGYDLGGAQGYPERYLDKPEQFSREGYELDGGDEEE